jgi:hypothetical protein
VGLLLDSTYERLDNYEKAWLSIHDQVFKGDIDASAIKEVRAPNPELLRSDIYVETNRQYPGGSVERNIQWAETKRATDLDAGFAKIPRSKLSDTNVAEAATIGSSAHSRYTNNRQWLPTGVYDEVAVKGGNIPDAGSARFVVSEDRTTVYLSVTHYKGFTVKAGTSQPQVRNPFYKVVDG